jgi:hypothetical protein
MKDKFIDEYGVQIKLPAVYTYACTTFFEKENGKNQKYMLNIVKERVSVDTEFHDIDLIMDKNSESTLDKKFTIDAREKNDIFIMKLYKIDSSKASYVCERQMDKCFQPPIVFSSNSKVMSMMCFDKNKIKKEG